MSEYCAGQEHLEVKCFANANPKMLGQLGNREYSQPVSF